jgi:hypothetical protein
MFRAAGRGMGFQDFNTLDLNLLSNFFAPKKNKLDIHISKDKNLIRMTFEVWEQEAFSFKQNFGAFFRKGAFFQDGYPNKKNVTQILDLSCGLTTFHQQFGEIQVNQNINKYTYCLSPSSQVVLNWLGALSVYLTEIVNKIDEIRIIYGKEKITPNKNNIMHHLLLGILAFKEKTKQKINSKIDPYAHLMFCIDTILKTTESGSKIIDNQFVIDYLDIKKRCDLFFPNFCNVLSDEKSSVEQKKENILTLISASLDTMHTTDVNFIVKALPWLHLTIMDIHEIGMKQLMRAKHFNLMFTQREKNRDPKYQGVHIFDLIPEVKKRIFEKIEEERKPNFRLA